MQITYHRISYPSFRSMFSKTSHLEHHTSFNLVFSESRALLISGFDLSPLCLMDKYTRALLPNTLMELFTDQLTVVSKNTEHNQPFYIPFSRLSTPMRSVLLQVLKFWNNSTLEICEASSLSLFKLKLELYLKDK